MRQLFLTRQDKFFSQDNFFSRDNFFSQNNFFSQDNFVSLAFPNCLGLLYWYHQLELSWYLHQPELHQLSQPNRSHLERLGPIDRTPGIPGSDKNHHPVQVCEGGAGWCVEGASGRTLWHRLPSLHDSWTLLPHQGHLGDGDTGQVDLSSSEIISERFSLSCAGLYCTSRVRCQRCCWTDSMMVTPTSPSWELASMWWRRLGRIFALILILDLDP